MAKQNVMTVASLKKLLEKIGNEIEDDFQIWLSSDEEGNQFLPVYDIRGCVWRLSLRKNGLSSFLHINNLRLQENSKCCT